MITFSTDTGDASSCCEKHLILLKHENEVLLATITEKDDKINALNEEIFKLRQNLFNVL